MIYLVSSFYRSGSSMMMRCLDAGGMQIVYTRKQINYVAFHGYYPTPGGIFETGVSEFRRPDFIQRYDGKAAKATIYNLMDLPRHEYRLIFMLRNPESIRRSMLRYAPTAQFPNEDLTWLYEKATDTILTALEKRGDYQVITTRYEDIINNPVIEFERIRSFGFPIDVDKATGIVDARLQRNKVED